MISFIERHQRIILLLGLAFIFLSGGLTVFEFNLEFSGVLFVFSAFGVMFYAAFVRLFIKRKGEVIVQSWLRNERFGAALFIGILSLIGLVESYGNYLAFTVFFGELLLLAVLFSYLNVIKIKSEKQEIDNSVQFRFPTWAYWLFIIGNGVLILVTEEYFAGEEQFAIAMLCYLFALLFLISAWFFRQIKFMIKLKNEQAKTELLHLQTQVNPHFFFNMLNNLYGWVEKDPKTAKELIIKLSDMMRYSIYEGQKALVSIEEEVDYLKNYIELHKMRYHKKIDVSFKVDIQEAGYQIRPLLFVILLENAFKHGVEKLRENAFVYLVLTASTDGIYFEIENNFDPEEMSTTTGIGQKNLRRRLELVYPKQHSLFLIKQENVHKAQLTIKMATT